MSILRSPSRRPGHGLPALVPFVLAVMILAVMASLAIAPTAARAQAGAVAAVDAPAAVPAAAPAAIPAVAAAETSTAAGVVTLPSISVTGNPLGSELNDLVAPTSLLQGEALQQRLAPTLGDTLATMPSVAASGYGPNASRPVIRGLDGDRIRILQNGVAPFDASGTSVDHAVSIDPLLVRRVEIVRGPATLLYGSSAIGGVVNVIDDRIPDTRIDGASGAVSARYASPADERSLGATLAVGTARGLVLHADAATTRTDDLRIPGYARSAQLRAQDPLPPDEEPRDRLPNSAADNKSGAFGASYVGAHGFLGAAYSAFDSDYGTVAEEDVTIKLKQRRVDLAGALSDLDGFVKDLRFRASHSGYEHTEYEGSEAGTVFRNRGGEARLDATHRAVGPFEGAFGLQLIDFDFSALGEEGFLPRTHTRNIAGFVYERARQGDWTLELGGRVESARVAADDDPDFGPADLRRFTTGAASVGGLYALAPGWTLAASVVASSRPPNYQELYADGPHLATGIFEIGDRTLGVERSVGTDVSLRRTEGPLTGRVGVFYNRFRDFIAQYPTGETDPTFDVPVYRYAATRAEFMGAELEGRYAWARVAGGTLGTELRADWLRATDLDRDAPLPRMAPLRFGGALTYGRDAWDARIDLTRVQAQDRVAEDELPTSGYTMLDASIAWRFAWQQVAFDAFLRGTNLLDQEARNAVSFIKDIAPMAGRGVTIGLRAHF